MIRKCSNCGQANRIPAARLSQTGRCGACKSPLSPIAKPVDVGPEQFDDIIANSPVPVLVDFWAAWCGPCRMAAPMVSNVAKEQAGKAVVLKVDTQKHPQLASRYDVRGIPNFIVFKDGQPVHQKAGVARESEMRSWLRL